MKTEPTDLDREAARLFVPAPGVRMWCAVEDRCIPLRFLGRNPINLNLWAFDEVEVCAVVEVLASMFRVVAIDTDDDATVGVMVAQVEAALEVIDRPRGYLHPWDGGWAMRHGEAIRRYAGPTKGAALVAAMRALKGRP